ncbi:MAG: hypothetical protein R3C15_15955 [Thermoleophilia bacterium]
MSLDELRERARDWPSRRFSQAISEGDGISVIPVLRGDVAALAAAAEAAGAEAVAVETVDDVRRVRAHTDLPILLRARSADHGTLVAARAEGTDALSLAYEERLAEDELAELQQAAEDLGLDWALEVRDEGQLEEALDGLDPEIVVLSEASSRRDEDDLDRALDLLPSVPVGKLVVSESAVSTRDHVLDLERAGVDAVIVAVPESAAGLADALRDLLDGQA